MPQSHYPEFDFEAMRGAILAELARQGVEFAEVKTRPLYPGETHMIILTHYEAGLMPKYVELCRVTNQLAEMASKKAANDDK